MDEQNKFLESLDIKGEKKDVFDEIFPVVKPEEEVEEKPSEDDETKLRNRREKRLAEKLQAERESSIRLAERLATLTEAQKFKEDTGEEYAGVDRIYGTDTPEAKTATELLKSALKGVEERSTNRALEQFREEQSRASQEVANEEKQLDSMIEEIEDENGVILTSAQQKGFFTLLERMSPKDNEGNVIHYADPNAVWEVYQSKTQRPDTRAKDLSSRSMVASGASKETKLETDALERQLRDEGII